MTMSVENIWGHYFKPEVKKSGSDYVRQDNVILSHASDTQIQTFFKGSTPVRVSLAATNVASESFTADCSCPLSKKGQFCKHIWATLLVAETKHPDFLESRKTIEKITPTENPKASAYQAKQADYRKQQYQRQKERARAQKQKSKKSIEKVSEFPDDVEQALHYFSENGFPMQNPVSQEELRNAKKKLATVFHPDKGGSHAEILELNEQFDVLIAYWNF